MFQKTKAKVIHCLVLIVMMQLCLSIQQLNSKNQVLVFYEEYSYLPMVHVYYNRHFHKAKQFDNFLDVIQEVQYMTKDYAKIVMTNCDDVHGEEQLTPCVQIKRLNENRIIVGYLPSEEFTKFGTIVMQSPPTSRAFDHYTDVYTAQQIKNFIDSLTPNFYKQLTNIEMFQQFKRPRYVPKLVYATRQDDIPPVLRQLGIAYFLRFDLALVSDLTESIVNQLQISSFPTLLVIKHNYQTQKLEVVKYQGNDFSIDQSSKIKKFLDQHALKAKRNDHLFHLIKRPTSNDVLTVDNLPQFDNNLDKGNGWVMVAQGPTAETLYQNKKKYGLFFQYVHFLKPEQTKQRIFLYNPRSNLKYQYNEMLEFRRMNAQDFYSNATIFLSKDSVVMGVRQQYAHMCTVVDKFLFKGLAQCFVIQQSQYEKVAHIMGLEFKFGFVCSSQGKQNKIKGHQLRSADFADVYETLEYSTRHKVKQIVDKFIDNPIQQISKSVKLIQLCAQPLKKCILYFSQSQKKDKTKRQYLQASAVHYANEYKFYEIDMSCNQHFYEQILPLQTKTGGLIAYYPRLNKYVLLKAKMTKGVIEKFLKINNSQQRVLPFKEFDNEQIQIYNCQQNKRQKTQKVKEEQKQKEVPVEQFQFDQAIQL